MTSGKHCQLFRPLGTCLVRTREHTERWTLRLRCCATRTRIWTQFLLRVIGQFGTYWQEGINLGEVTCSGQLHWPHILAVLACPKTAAVIWIWLPLCQPWNAGYIRFFWISRKPDALLPPSPFTMTSVDLWTCQPVPSSLMTAPSIIKNYGWGEQTWAMFIDLLIYKCIHGYIWTA